jgi:hypothetical protein
LKDFGDFADCVEYVNQREYGDGQLEGQWWYDDDEHSTIYYGSFGNDNSPGASSCTYAEVYDDKTEYLLACAEWMAAPEYLDIAEGDDEYTEDGEQEEPYPYALLTREECFTLLESCCIACYESESDEVLRAAVQANVEDGTISPDELP